MLEPWTWKSPSCSIVATSTLFVSGNTHNGVGTPVPIDVTTDEAATATVTIVGNTISSPAGDGINIILGQRVNAGEGRDFALAETEVEEAVEQVRADLLTEVRSDEVVGRLA